MSANPTVTDSAAKLLQGAPTAPFPKQPVPPIAVDKEPRDFALERLALFFSRLIYFRTGANGQVVPFRIRRRNIHVEQPDNEDSLRFPGIAFIPGQGESVDFGLGAPLLLEQTKDRFAPGTAVIARAEYVETVTVEVWGSHIPERRAIAAGIRRAMGFSEESFSIRMPLPDYFGVVAEYTLNTSLRIDDPDVIRNRRRAHFMVEIRLCEAQLVAVTEIKPTIDVVTLDGNIFLDLDC